MTCSRTYAERVTDSERELCRPRRSRGGWGTQTRSHTAPPGWKRVQTQILFALPNNAMCRNMAQWHTKSCLRACLMNCSPPIENQAINALLAPYQRRTRADPPPPEMEQGARLRQKVDSKFDPSEPLDPGAPTFDFPPGLTYPFPNAGGWNEPFSYRRASYHVWLRSLCCRKI